MNSPRILSENQDLPSFLGRLLSGYSSPYTDLKKKKKERKGSLADLSFSLSVNYFVLQLKSNCPNMELGCIFFKTYSSYHYLS